MRRVILRCLLTAFLLFLFAWPLGTLFKEAVEEKGFFLSLREISEAFLSPVTLRTLSLAASVAFLCTVAGTLFGWFLAFQPVPFSRILNASLLIPLVLPNYVFGIAWLPLIRGWAYTFWGCVFVLTLCWVPLTIFLTRRAFTAVPLIVHEAAQVDGARKHDLLFRIDIPLIANVILSTFILTFILVTVAFGVPSLLLVQVSTFDVFTQFSAFYDQSGATLMSIPILIVSISAILLERSFRRGTPIHILDYDSPETTARTHSNKITGFVVFLAGISPGMVPLGVLVLRTFVGVNEGAWGKAWSLIHGAIHTSLILSTVGGVVLCVVGACVALALDPKFFRKRNLLVEKLGDTAILLMFAVPPAVWALAFLRFWNNAGFLSPFIADSGALLFIGYLARFLPITYRVCKDGMETVPSELIETAWLEGAGLGQLVFFVLIPFLKKVLAVSFAIGFVLVFGELTITLFCAPPGMATLPIRLYTVMANAPISVVSCVALTVVLVCVPFALVSLRLSGQGGK